MEIIRSEDCQVGRKYGKTENFQMTNNFSYVKCVNKILWWTSTSARKKNYVTTKQGKYVSRIQNMLVSKS